MDENESMQMALKISIRRIDQQIRGLYSTYTIKEIKDQNREIKILRFTKDMIPQRINIEDYINVIIEVYDQYHKTKKNQSFIYMDKISQRNHHKTNMTINQQKTFYWLPQKSIQADLSKSRFNSGGITQPQEYSSTQQTIHLLLLFKSYSFEYINKIDYFNQRILKDLKFKWQVNRTKVILNYLKIRKIFYLVEFKIKIYSN